MVANQWCEVQLSVSGNKGGGRTEFLMTPSPGNSGKADLRRIMKGTANKRVAAGIQRSEPRASSSRKNTQHTVSLKF